MGKSSAPAAPDYTAAANATAAGNLDAAKYAVNANRINQYTPYGSLTYTKGTNADGSENWSQNETLTPQAQATLDKQLSLSDKYADVASQGFDKISGLLANPQLDTSALPARAIGVGQTAQDAILSRLNPQFAQQEEATRARLANQGITLGSGAYGQEMTQQSQARNDAEIAASLQGISLDQQNRQSALEEQAYLQDRPLNLVNALRSGAQVQSPQFSNFAQQQTTAGPDLLGAATQQYQADLNSTNASNANSAGLVSGLLGTGLGIAGLGTGGGATLGGSVIKGLFR